MTPTSWFLCLWGYLGALKTNLLLPEGGFLFNVPEILLLDVRDETEYASARLVTAPMQKPIKDEGGCNGNNRKPRRTRVLKKKIINWVRLINAPLKEFRFVCLPVTLALPVYEKQNLAAERQKILLQFCPTQQPDDVKFWFSSCLT